MPEVVEDSPSSETKGANGATALLRTLRAAGIDTIFGNPGTSEMQLVAALDTVSDMRSVLCLFEGVCTGAADGYARMRGRPAATLLHLGPGLANGMANLHNARRAGTPVLNIVGDHAVDHRALDAPLTSDIAALAAAMGQHVTTIETREAVTRCAGEAVSAALSDGGSVSTLIVPADIAWSRSETTDDGPATFETAQPACDPAEAAAIVATLTKGAGAMLLVRGGDMSLADMDILAGIAATTGCRIATPTFNSRLPRGRGRHAFERIPYLAEMAVPMLAGITDIVLLNVGEPVSFFAYPGKPSRLLAPGCRILPVRAHSPRELLAVVAEMLGATPIAAPSAPPLPPLAERGTLDVQAIGAVLAHRLPDDAIVVDESVTAGMILMGSTVGAAPHDWLDLTGGSIGQGLPLAVGTAVACPERKTICLVGDGSAMYTNQALWSMARERLDVVTVVLANRAYRVLQFEMQRTGASGESGIGPRAAAALSLEDPALDFVAMARGMGVPAGTAATVEEFQTLFEKALAVRGPFLIEAVI